MPASIRFSHPAYDCIYLSLAVANGWTFVTADAVLVRKLRHLASTSPLPAIQLVADAAADK